MINRMIQFIFGPHSFEVAALFFAATGIALALSSDRDDIVKAHWFFGVAFLLAFGRAAQFIIVWKDGSFAKYALSFVLFGAVGMGWILVQDWVNAKAHKLDPIPSTGAKKIGSESADANSTRSGETKSAIPAPSPVDGLSELGWTVQPGLGAIQFEVTNRSLPVMKESAVYFGLLHRPFWLHFQSVTNLEGLHYLIGNSNCIKIEINAGAFTDISELRGLSSLKSLIISQVPINGLGIIDPSPIASLTNLHELNLYSTKITQTDAFSRLAKLATLNLKETPIRDLTPIAGLVSLETLDITGTGVSDLSPISHFRDLRELGVGARQVPGLVNLSNLKSLRTLRLIDQIDVDISPIGSLSNLENLWIWGLPEINASALGKLTKLLDLSIMGSGFGRQTPVTNVDALGNLKELRKLTLGSLLLHDLAFVSGLTNLNEINIGEMPIVSVAPLRNLTSLKSISLNATSVVDISPLLDLPALNTLTVVRTPARSDVLTELERRGVKINR